MGEAAGTIFTILLFIAAFFGSGAYAVLSIADFRAARRGFWATAISFAAIGIVLGIMTTWPLPVRMLVCATFLGIVGGGLIWIFDYLKAREALGVASQTESTTIDLAKPVSQSPGILLDFAFEVLPRVSPPDGTIHIFEIAHEQTGIEASLVEHQFSPSEMIDWRKRFPDWPIFGVSKCEVTSTTNESVFYAVIPVNLKFREMIPDTPGLPPVEIGGMVQSTNGIQMRSGRVMMTQQSSFKVGRIYPQTPYVIYFINRTKYLVDIEVPSEGKVQDFSKTGADFESKLNMKLGRTTGLHLSAVIPAKALQVPAPPTPSPPNTQEKK